MSGTSTGAAPDGDRETPEIGLAVALVAHCVQESLRFNVHQQGVYSMRAVLLILILVVVAALAAVATGFVDINQTRSAEVPAVSATREGIAAKGGQSPAFEVQTGQVAIGSRDATVKVPAINVMPARGSASAPAAPPAQAAPARVAPAPAPAPVANDEGVSDTNAVQR
jgi:hypothetical protein